MKSPRPWNPAGGRRAAAGLALLALACAARPAPGQTSLFDPRFDEVRRASVAWDRRVGPDREVVDLVCLVPDLPSFFEAVSAWDDRHFFPVLIDDVETTFTFLRAFRPARVVRLPSRPAAGPGDDWSRAVAAVGRSWSAAGVPDAKTLRGDAPPSSLGPVPPGVVVASPGSPALAGAVALAAGRFQPLLKWETAKHGADTPDEGEARALALTLESLVADRIPRYDRLGDDCDFVTLAGDYPYRYRVKDGGLNAFDDLILRPADGKTRWAFAGRLMGTPAQSAYRAMCALFLHPSSALLYNTYAETGAPWAEYTMGAAAAKLGAALPVTHKSGPRATLPAWHQTFDPVNRFGLVALNTHGGPTTFHLEGGGGQTADTPESVPTAVLMIHSFSAQAPDDPETIAGRWLANGAFVYFGSVHEPFLQAFRPPGLVATFLAENLPVVAAVRRSGSEPFGQPWRLVYLGDPLYRLRPAGTRAGRLKTWNEVEGWPAYVEFRQPPADAPESVRLNWVLKTAVFGFQTAVAPRQRVDLAAALGAVRRDRLDAPLRPLYDDLTAALLVPAGKTAELIERFETVDPPDRSPALRRHLETAQTAALMKASAEKDLRRARALWTGVIRAPASRDFARTFTERVGRLVDTPARLADWRDRLDAALRANAQPDNKPAIEAELKRVDEQIKNAKRH